MIVTEKKRVPIYDVTCCECKSKIQYKKSEVFTCHIQCPCVWCITLGKYNSTSEI